MATPEPMDITQIEGNLYDQDRKRFKPLRAIRRMFRGRKKSKELSQSLGILPLKTEEPDRQGAKSAFARSMSHESVFAIEGIASAVPVRNGFKHAFSLGDVTDVTVPVDRLKGTDAAKSMSLESDVNKSTQALSAKDNDMDMNDIADNVERLNNKAAYDKIALRPKRRPARNARGTKQQHVIRIEPQVNGHAEEDTTEQDGETKEDSARDVSPPKAKKSRPPSSHLITVETDDEKMVPSSAECTSTTTKRLSMLGRSPVGPGPGMIVPTLDDVQKIKLRKRQPDGKEKEVKEAANRVVTKLKPEPEEGNKIKATKKTNAAKKSSKQEQKGSSEGGLSKFPWKKSASPKSPPATETSTENLKEIKKSKGFFPGLKSAKKNTQEKDSKSSATAKFFSFSDKKDAPTKKGTRGVKPEKDNSENICKAPHEIMVDVAEEDIEESDVPTENFVRTFPASPEIERADMLPGKFEEETSLLEQISTEMSEREEKSGGRRENASSKHAVKLKLEAEKLSQNRFDDESKLTSPSSPADLKKHVIEGKKMTVSADVEQPARTEKTRASRTEEIDAESEKITRSAAKKPFSPPVKEKPRPFSFKKPERLPSVAAKAQEGSSVTGLAVEMMEDAESDDKSSIGVKASEIKAFHSSPPVVAQVQRAINTEEPNTPNPRISSSPLDHESKRNTPKSTISSSPLNHESKRTETTAKANDQASSEASTPPQDKPKVQSTENPVDRVYKTVDTVTVQNKTERSTAPKRETQLEVSQKSDLSAKDGHLSSSREDLKRVETAERRLSSASARTAVEDSPVQFYSRIKLKSVGDNLPGRRSASVKISPMSSPSRASRPKSFNIKSARTNAEIEMNKEHKSESASEKSKVTAASPKPSSTKEKPKMPEKPKSPLKLPSQTTSIKSLMQDAENNNARPLNAAKESVEKTTPVSEQAIPKRPTSKPQREDEVKVGAPSWVQMARRRSKIWDDSGYKPQKNTMQRTPSTEYSDKQDVHSRVSITATKCRLESFADKTPATSGDRPKTLPITAKPRANSISTVSKSDTTPSNPVSVKQPTGSKSKVPHSESTSKSSPLSPSSKVQRNRTASIPNISMMSPRKITPSPTKEVTSPGQPSWLSIAMQKQKNWVKEEAV